MRKVPYATARLTAYEYVIFRGNIHRRSTKNKMRKWYDCSWSKYDVTIGNWKPEYNVYHYDFSPTDYVEPKVAYAFKEQLDKKYEEENKRGALIDMQYNGKENYDKEITRDFTGKYVYFENSNNLYKVLNSEREVELYVGNGIWNNRGNKLTLVGVVNNIISEEEAKRRMRLADEAINGANKVDDPDKKKEEDYTGAYFEVSGRLFKAVEFQNNPKFRRYRCNKYAGEGQWEHAGFYSAKTIIENRVSSEKAEELMSAKDTKTAVPKAGYQEPLQEAPKELKSDNIKFSNCSSPVENKEPELELRVGAYFMCGYYLRKVTALYHKTQTVFSEQYDPKSQRFLKCEETLSFSNVKYLLITEEEALEYISKHNTSSVLIDASPEFEEYGVPGMNLTIKVGAYFLHRGHLMKITKVNFPTLTVEADYLSYAYNDFRPWGVPVRFADIERDLITEEDALSRMNKKSASPEETYKGDLVGEKVTGTISIDPEAFKGKLKVAEDVLDAVASEFKDRNIVHEIREAVPGEYSIKYDFYESGTDPTIGHAEDLNTAKEDIASMCAKHFPGPAIYGIPPEPKKVMVVKVPVTITSGATIHVWIDKVLRSCIVEDVIMHPDYNITVEGFRAESIADLLEDVTMSKVSKERLVELIQDKLEESYIKLKFDVEGRSKQLYLSRTQLSKQLEVVRSIYEDK